MFPSALEAYSIEDSTHVLDTLCGINDGFLVANGATCSASTPKIANTLSSHIPELEAIRRKYETQRKALRKQKLSHQAMKHAMAGVFKAEAAELDTAHAKWADRHGGFCPT